MLALSLQLFLDCFNQMNIRPCKKIQGTLSLPGDKSISHRAAMMAAIAEGATRIENYSPGADCASTLSCLEQLGVRIEREENTVSVHGAGKHGLKEFWPGRTLNAR
jgi:3-phosphoshikimate 1-carboxyvinyltransferase